MLTVLRTPKNAVTNCDTDELIKYV